ncbi:MAG: winged helix-turn-helix domain-containing protein [Aeromicrobium erythreum]
MDKPAQRPEGQLLEAAIKNDPALSIRKLAKRVGVSEGRVRQIVNGYASAGRGQYVDVRAPAATLARLAWHADISGIQLRDAGRPDAALELERYYDENPDERSDAIDWGAVRAWVESPYGSKPPTALLEVFDDDAIVSEIRSRMSAYRQTQGELNDLISADLAERNAAIKNGGPEHGDSSAEKSGARAVASVHTLRPDEPDDAGGVQATGPEFSGTEAADSDGAESVGQRKRREQDEQATGSQDTPGE